MDLTELHKPLSISDVEFRVQSVNKGGFVKLLAYKDARVDMTRLDEVVGAMNWKREHTRDNHNCIVSIYDEDKKEWVSKEDTGTASAAEAQKGLASDSFKRACFNWGIGRELYSYPPIEFKLKPDEFEVKGDKAFTTWKLKIKNWTWYSEFQGDQVTFLAAKDDSENIRFKWGTQGVGEAL